MLKFFRKIRLKLLAENRVTRYLAYAIGEIFLVVIGILIALQVNNWNEERKTEKAQKSILISFMEDLKADSLAIKNHVGDLERILGVHREMHQVRNGHRSLIDLKNPGLIRGSIRYSSIVLMNNPDFGSKVLNPDIKKEVLNYYQGLSRVKNSYEQYDNVIKDIVRPYMREQMLMNEEFYFTEEKLRDGILSLNIENLAEVIKREDFSQILIEANLKAVELKTNLERILEANEKLNRSLTDHISGYQ